MKLTLLRSVAMACLIASSVSISPATVIQSYPLPSIYTASTVYALSVNGVSIPVTSYNSYYDYAHFSMSGGSATVTVTLIPQAITSSSISPKKYNISATTSGSTYTFTIPSNRYLIVQLNSYRRLVIAADPGDTAPPSSGTGIYNVLASPYNADNSGSALTTAAIQNAINDASAFTGGQGIVYVPPGVYTVGNIYLKNDVAMYVAGGAVFKFTGNPVDYRVDYHKDSQGRNVTWWFSTEFGANNVKLYGRGTLDGRGAFSTSTYNFACNNLVPIGCTNFICEGLILRDSGAWNTTPIRSNDVTFSYAKFFNRMDLGEDDGIDVEESQNVLVQHSIGIALDDPFSAKTWQQSTDGSVNWPGSPEVQNGVTFDDCISWTHTYGFKVGQGVIQPQSNITFSNGVVYDCSVGIGIDFKYGNGPINNVTFDTIDIERVTSSNGTLRNWASFLVRDNLNTGGGPLIGLTVRNITVRDKGTMFSSLRGFSQTNCIGPITFDNVVMPGSATPAQNLTQMNIIDRAYYSSPTILPVQIAEPPVRTNLAWQKAAVASSSASPSTPGLVTDDKLATRWGSNYTNSEWIYVDLGTSTPVNGVGLFWEAYGASYNIQTSNDATNWTTVYSKTGGVGGMEFDNFLPTTARYVRMQGVLRGTSFGYSLWEFQVYGPPGPGNYATSGAVTATSSLENANWGSARIRDGQSNSITGSMGWTSNSNLTANHTEAITFDFGSNRTVGEVDIYPRNDAGNIGQNFPINFTIQTSVDNVNWTARITKTGYSQPNNSVQSFGFASTAARYVRIEGTSLRPNPGDSNQYRMAFAEVVISSGNLAAAAGVSATSDLENSDWGYAKVHDGQSDSVTGSKGWTSNSSLTANHTEAITFDLGAAQTVAEVVLNPRNDSGNVGQNFPIDFTIQTSTDNVNWTTRITQTGYLKPGDGAQVFGFSVASARYVKVQGTNLRPNPNDTNQYRMAFAEVEIYYLP